MQPHLPCISNFHHSYVHHLWQWLEGVPGLLYNLPQSSSLPICHFPLCREWQGLPGWPAPLLNPHLFLLKPYIPWPRAHVSYPRHVQKCSATGNLEFPLCLLFDYIGWLWNKQMQSVLKKCILHCLPPSITLQGQKGTLVTPSLPLWLCPFFTPPIWESFPCPSIECCANFPSMHSHTSYNPIPLPSIFSHGIFAEAVSNPCFLLNITPTSRPPPIHFLPPTASLSVDAKVPLTFNATLAFMSFLSPTLITIRSQSSCCISAFVRMASFAPYWRSVLQSNFEIALAFALSFPPTGGVLALCASYLPYLWYKKCSNLLLKLFIFLSNQKPWRIWCSISECQAF